jgi:hypothetical protein
VVLGDLDGDGPGLLGAGPTAAETAWVDPAYSDPQVDHAARSVFDYDYDGAGNWPFNTAYAGTRGLDSFVTRLRSLIEPLTSATARRCPRIRIPKWDFYTH